VLGVLLVLALLVLGRVALSEEDFARGVIGPKRKLEREGWLRCVRRRMRIVRADAMDGRYGWRR
jgi:hypothetical protein